MDIEVLQVRLQSSEKPLKAFVDINFDGLVIRDFKVIQQPESKAYVAAPQTVWKGQQGKTNFKPIISMPNAMKWQVESAILAEYQRARERIKNEKT